LSALLKTVGLHCGYGADEIIHSVDLEVAPGEVVTILGPNGCGKTTLVKSILGGSGSGKSTLLRFLVGLETPARGEVAVAGYGAPALGRGRPPFGVMFQQGALFGSMTVLDNVALPLEEWTSLGSEAVHTIARYKLRQVGLGDAADKLPSELSGGMTKRAAIARALALDDGLLFLDEPSAGLDPKSAAELDDLILTLARTSGVTVIIVTHELESVFRVADRCLLLDKETKSVLAIGDPRVLRDGPDARVAKFFHPETKVRRRAWQPVQTT
jgi:phospholipid/cholesterol/gamma-HCH transport system ATP-binding protein